MRSGIQAISVSLRLSIDIAAKQNIIKIVELNARNMPEQQSQGSPWNCELKSWISLADKSPVLNFKKKLLFFLSMLAKKLSLRKVSKVTLPLWRSHGYMPLKIGPNPINNKISSCLFRSDSASGTVILPLSNNDRLLVILSIICLSNIGKTTVKTAVITVKATSSKTNFQCILYCLAIHFT